MKLSKNKKIIYSVLIVVVVLLLSYKIPTLARFKNRGISSSNVWSGMVASKYRSGTGTIDDPYIISNGDELAFFSSQLENNNYEDEYFKISNDILLNEGVFKYENDYLKYEINGNSYYLNGTDYYETTDFTLDRVGSINEFPSLENFKGTLDGDSHVIYGYYNSDALFTNLGGNVSSLYIENAAVNNGGIFADTITDSTILNIVVDGLIISNTYIPDLDEPLVETQIDDYEEMEKPVIGGIANYINNSSMINCINKSNIIGGYLVGGLVGYSEDSTILNSYSTGNIDAYNSNMIGVFKGIGTIDKIYSTGIINNALIGYVISSTLDISNSFIVTDNYLVSYTSDSTITSLNNYYTGQGKGINLTSTQATLANLQDKNFLSNYGEFVDLEYLEEYPLNIWMFEEDSYPMLYIDDVVNSYSELYVNTTSYNSYSPIIVNKNYNSNITFIVSDIDQIHTTTKYYYLSNTRQVLSKSDLDNVVWIPYDNSVTISEEGFYIIYIKLVDNNSHVSYINSDLLILDKSGSSVDITMNSQHYTTLTSGEVYLDAPFSLSVSATDALSGIKSIEYYLSNSEINDLDTITWETYTTSIPVSSVGQYKLYVKVTDECDFITYASTPLVIYEGYVVSNLKPINYNTGNTITKKSSIMFDIDYSNNRQLNITHNLVTSTPLPQGAKIIMMDKTNNKSYQYVVNTNTSTYPLTLFSEIGKNTVNYYTESQVTNESFTFVIDFSGCEILNDFTNLYAYLEGVNSGVVRPTIVKQSFNILSGNVELTHTVSTSSNSTITYNSDSITNIEINNTVTLNGAYDTSYADKKMGLAIKVVDSNGTVVDRSYLKNIIFKIGDTKYAPDSDNIIRINLNTSESSVVNLAITTYDGNITLNNGTYYIKIYGYASLDGMYYSNNDLTNPITIPLYVLPRVENNNYNYSFNVLFESQNRIIDKGQVENFSFRISNQGIANPNIKVSMYRKNQLTAYNQDYTLIDMQDYTSDTLSEFIEGVYYANISNSIFNYTLDTTNLTKTGYKFVFDLYDGNVKVESISKYIIIR